MRYPFRHAMIYYPIQQPSMSIKQSLIFSSAPLCLNFFRITIRALSHIIQYMYRVSEPQKIVFKENNFKVRKGQYDLEI